MFGSFSAAVSEMNYKARNPGKRRKQERMWGKVKKTKRAQFP